MTAKSANPTMVMQARAAYAHLAANSGLWLLFAGVAVMFVPTLLRLFTTGLWTDDEHSHGPIILSISLWLLWKRWHEALPMPQVKPAPALAWACFVLAAVLYIPGRAVDLIYFEAAAFIPAMTGVVLLAGGTKLLDKLKFPLIFMLFMVPLPNALVGPISSLMKIVVSVGAEWALDLLGYPVSRNGVIIGMGQYMLLVADACAGMRTLFMLEALGILYLNLVHHSSLLRNIMLPILIIPISLTANVIRVIVLALITYHWGDEAGQGFLHGFAGMVLFIAGLVIMMGTDSLLRLISRRFRHAR